jgi:hypothetical protein
MTRSSYNDSGIMNFMRLECNFGLPRVSFSAGVQATLICLEMFVAAVFHRRIFSYREYRPALPCPSPEMGFGAAMRDTFRFHDVALSMRQIGREIKREIRQGAIDSVHGVEEVGRSPPSPPTPPPPPAPPCPTDGPSPCRIPPPSGEACI